MINEEMSPSELLSAFLDGELAEQETSSLFYALAQNPDLQTEMRQHITLHNAVQGASLTIPAHLQDDIFAKTGFAPLPPTDAAIVGAASTGILAYLFKSRVFGMLFGGVLASLATFGIMRNSNEPAPALTENNTHNDFKNSLAENAVQQPLQQQQALSVIPPVISAENEKIAAAFKEGFKKGMIAGNRNAARTSEEQVYDNHIPRTLPQDENREMVTIMPDGRTMESNVRQTRLMPEKPASKFKFEYGAPPAPLTPSAPGKFSGFVGGTSALYSFPGLDLSNPSEPAYNNMRVAVNYHLTESSQIGLEAGSETFMQSFTGLENGKVYRFEQNYPALWAGASYQYSFSGIEVLSGARPFVRGIAGGTAVGPLLKGSVGLMHEYNNLFGISAAIEGTALGYAYQGKPFSTQKIGFRLGLFIRPSF